MKNTLQIDRKRVVDGKWIAWRNWHYVYLILGWIFIVGGIIVTVISFINATYGKFTDFAGLVISVVGAPLAILGAKVFKVDAEKETKRKYREKMYD